MVARALTNRITQEAYEHIFQRMFEGVQSRHSTFKAGVSLRGIVVDWSDTQRSALGPVLGEDVAVSLCKGCKVTDIVQDAATLIPSQKVLQEIPSNGNKDWLTAKPWSEWWRRPKHSGMFTLE